MKDARHLLVSGSAHDELVRALQEVKRATMHARRFGPETLQSYRSACVAAEAAAEDALNALASMTKAAGSTS